MPDRNPSDADLLARADTDAHMFRVFYDRYAEAMHRYFVRRGTGHHTALDLTAETFAASWLSRHRFRDPGDGNAGPWLYGIARNTLSHFLRHHAVVTTARERLGLLVDRAAIDPVADGVVANLDDHGDLDGPLGALSVNARRAVELRVVHGSSYEEISESLGCTPLAARIKVSRALADLRGDLREHRRGKAT